MRKNRDYLRLLGFALVVGATVLLFGIGEGKSQSGAAQKEARLGSARWKATEKIPQMTVLATTQTSDGYLWFGTQKGLLRFDGADDKLLTTDNTPALKSNMIQTLLETADQSLWIGTAGGGLTRLKDGEFTNFSTGQGLSDDFVQSLVEGGEGTIFIGTGKGLDKFDYNRSQFQSVAELEGKNINALALTGDKKLWIGSYGDGLYLLEQNRISNFSERDGLLSDYIWSLGVDRRDNLWIGTREGVSYREADSFKNYTAPEQGFQKTVYTILPKDDGTVLFGTDSAGVIRFDGANWLAENETNGLPSNCVYALTTDREATLWAGTLGGTAQANRQKFTNLTATDGLRGNIASAVSDDRAGNLWIGTEKGLNLFKQGRFAESVETQAVGGRPVYGLLEDRAGRLWVGTKGGGLFGFEGGKTFQFTQKNGLPNDIVYSILQTRRGKLWIATYGGGICEMQDGKFNCYREADGLLSDFTSFLFEDRDENLWIIGKDGISRFKDDQFTKFPAAENGLPKAEIFSVNQTSDGLIWIGTDGSGLYLFENGQFKAVGKHAGLRADSVFNLVEDSQGFVWLAGSGGISRIHLSELKKAVSDASAPVAADNFDTSDGLSSNNCTGSSPNTIRLAADGRIYFTTIRGIAAINPRRLNFNLLPPPVTIEKIIVNEKETPPGGTNFEFAAEANRLVFQYAALSYANPSKARFKYQLAGFDPDWIEAGSERTARYNNLPPGDYVFRVVAANDDGVWNETGASFSFTKKPSFFQTRWFAFLVGTLFIALGIGLYWLWSRRKFRRIEENHRIVLQERTRLAREVHDTLAQGLSGIRLQLQAAQIADGKGLEAQSREHLNLAYEITQDNLTEARQWIRVLSTDIPEANYLPQRLTELVQKTNRQNGVKLHFSGADFTPPLPVETLEHIFRIAQEAVNNSVKHAAAGNIRIELRHNSKQLMLAVTDDGRGFDQTQDNRFGFGRRSMQERAGLIGGKLHVESELEKGTIVKLFVPLDEKIRAKQ